MLWTQTVAVDPFHNIMHMHTYIDPPNVSPEVNVDMKELHAGGHDDRTHQTGMSHTNKI